MAPFKRARRGEWAYACWRDMHVPHAARILTSHESRGVCLGVWCVVFWPSWYLVHHTTMAPFKRARRGEWAYACWRDMHVPHVARILTSHESRGVCLGVWCVVFWPSWYLVHHTTMTPFKRARRGEWAYACWRDMHVPSRTQTHQTRVEMHLWCVFGSMVCCFLAKLVLGPPHYHGTFQTCQTWRVGVCFLAICAHAK